jgi:hypothetical protein
MQSEPARIALNLGSDLRIYPSVWPGKQLSTQPGDLSLFVLPGNNACGYQNGMQSNPFTDAPKTEGAGGIIYFDNDIAREDLDALMRMWGRCSNKSWPPKDYTAFIAESKQPSQEGYLAQMRIVDKFGLRHLFSALTDAEDMQFPEQELNLVEALWRFIEHERNRWGTSFTEDEAKGLAGLFGGNGDYAREQLSFGLMLENGYYDIIRIWSRAWLVTK